jgi:quinol monooxygenase YgiN
MITLINKVTVTGDLAEFRRANEELADYMRVQPGARRFQLLQSTDAPEVFVEVAEWESREHHQRALQAPGFLDKAKALRAVADFERNLYTVVRTEEGQAVNA